MRFVIFISYTSSSIYTFCLYTKTRYDGLNPVVPNLEYVPIPGRLLGYSGPVDGPLSEIADRRLLT